MGGHFRRLDWPDFLGHGISKNGAYKEWTDWVLWHPRKIPEETQDLGKKGEYHNKDIAHSTGKDLRGKPAPSVSLLTLQDNCREFPT